MISNYSGIGTRWSMMTRIQNVLVLVFSKHLHRHNNKAQLAETGESLIRVEVHSQQYAAGVHSQAPSTFLRKDDLMTDLKPTMLCFFFFPH
jgi:hypothetical protein